MKRYSRLKLVLLNTLTFVSIFSCITFAEVSPNIHKDCVNCHLSEGTGKIADINATCLKCHPGSKNDHPLGVISRITPEKLPLDNGKITCVTCHEPHGKDTIGTLLRMDFNSLCLSCHWDK